METVFVICATVGGSVLLIQLAMMLIGLGGHALDFDGPDVGHGDIDVSGDMDVGGHMDVGDHVSVGDHGGMDADTSTDAHHFDSSWMFAVLSFRTIVAALTFFGLGGLAAQSAEISKPMVLGVAVAAGLAAMFAVYWMMRGLMSLKAEGTARVERAIGGHGTVYITIPAEESGRGKIQMNVQGRTMEYTALTPGHALSPGTQVVVTEIVNSDTVEVKPILESDE